MKLVNNYQEVLHGVLESGYKTTVGYDELNPKPFYNAFSFGSSSVVLRSAVDVLPFSTAPPR